MLDDVELVEAVWHVAACSESACQGVKRPIAEFLAFTPEYAFGVLGALVQAQQRIRELEAEKTSP